MTVPGCSNPLLMYGDAGAFQVSRSLRYNAPDSAYLNRTPSVAGNRKIFTFSCWVKLGQLGTQRDLFSAAESGTSNPRTDWRFDSSNNLTIEFNPTGSSWVTLTSSAVYRDTSAWYHVVVAVDTTQATSSDRTKVYINNVQQTMTGSYVSQNTDLPINNTWAHSIGRYQAGATSYFDGYLANVQFIDGQQLTPSSFTEVSATTGQLIPKAYTGNYGFVSVAAATGALPIFNTTDTYGAAKGSGTRTDANSSSIVLAVPMDGTNGGTSFGDQSATIKGSGSAKTITVNSATTSTSQSKFYGSSGSFNGSSASLSLADSADWAFGSGDFTIETWAYLNSGSLYFGQGDGSSPAFIVYGNTVYLGPSVWTDSFTFTTPPTGRWFHFALVRNGNTLTVYINGVSSGSLSYSSTWPDSSDLLTIGQTRSVYTNGYFQDFRIYKGVAKYTSNFSPVTSYNNSFYLQFADNSSNTASTLGKDTSGNGNNWTPSNFSITTGTGRYIPYVSNTGTIYSGSIADMFDGSASNLDTLRMYGGTWTLTPSPTITVSSSIRVMAFNDGSGRTNTLTANSTSVNVTDQTLSWRTITLPSYPATLTSLSATAGGSTGNDGICVSAIEIDGVILTDKAIVGPGNDSLVDTPTSYGTDTGVGGEVRGNYATLNPLVLGTSTLSNGNLEGTNPGNVRRLRSTIAMSSGKWYWEVVHSSGNAGMIGIISASSVMTDNLFGTGAGYYSFSGAIYVNGSTSVSGASYANGDVIGLALNLDSNQLSFYKNNSLQQTVSITSGVTWVAQLDNGDSVNSQSYVINFGQRAFAYPVSGYKALVDTNIPVVVAKPNTVMDVALYTGNGGTQTISGLAFEPDFVWLKGRSVAYSHQLYDQVRGAGKLLNSNLTSGESTVTDNLTAFTSAGFTLGNDAGTNQSSATYVAWAWDAGTSTVSNTQGSITSQVRANATAGFSVVTYTGTGANATVGHGLGVAPGFIIIKNRSSATNWRVYHSALGNTKAIFLSTTGASDTSSVYWNNTSPTSTVFSVGSDDGANGNTNSMVAYCFTPVVGYSSFGSYVGNGSSDGPMVWTGMRPRFLMIKRTDTGGSANYDWMIYDTARDIYNLSTKKLTPNSSVLEGQDSDGIATDKYLDILSNGFKIKVANAGINGSSGTFIYAAFAEAPFQYARAR